MEYVQKLRDHKINYFLIYIYISSTHFFIHLNKCLLSFKFCDDFVSMCLSDLSVKIITSISIIKDVQMCKYNLHVILQTVCSL